jgi:hypothetical protein
MQVSELYQSTTDAIIKQVLAREALRCQALRTVDLALLDELLDPQLIHTYSTGEIHDKAAYMRHVQGPAKLLGIERGALQVQVLGEVALMSGAMQTTLQPPFPVAAVSVQTHVLQVWRLDNGWRMLAFQATRLPQPSART